MTSLVLSVLLGCASCDSAPRSLERSNFSWADRRTEQFLSRADATYSPTADGYVAVLTDKDVGITGSSDVIVLLCLTDARSDCGTVELHAGVAVRVSNVGSRGRGDDNINRLRLLDRKAFHARRDRSVLKLSYEGELTGRSNFDDGSGFQWLSFNVQAFENDSRVRRIGAELYPLLKTEAGVDDLLECVYRIVHPATLKS